MSVPVRVALAGAVLTILIALAGGALRLGPPVSLRAAREPASDEFIAAVAALYRRAMIDSQTFEDRRENLNQANKLSRTYVTLLGLRGRTNFGAALTALPQRTLRPQTGCATPAD